MYKFYWVSQQKDGFLITLLEISKELEMVLLKAKESIEKRMRLGVEILKKTKLLITESMKLLLEKDYIAKK